MEGQATFFRWVRRPRPAELTAEEAIMPREKRVILASGASVFAGFLQAL